MGKSLSDIYRKKHDENAKEWKWNTLLGAGILVICMTWLAMAGAGAVIFLFLVIPGLLIFLNGLDMSGIVPQKQTDFIKSFICPHCLKTLKTKEINILCPFCDEEINGHEPSIFLKHKGDDCNSRIKHIECYKCKKPINLFAPYNEKRLEAKRYE